jgi:hypothetical protein
VFKYALDPNAVFYGVVLDPRLPDAEAVPLKQKLQNTGCQLPIEQSTLYQAPRLEPINRASGVPIPRAALRPGSPRNR